MKFNFFIAGFPQWLPYIAALYYIDLIFILPRIIFVIGKPAAAAVIIILTALWTTHAIALYYKKERNRKIHLAVIIIDFAFRFPFAINFILLRKNQFFLHETFFFIFNIIILIAALFSIYFLTDKRIKDNYL